MREVVKLHPCSKYMYDKNKMDIMPYTISTSISFHSCSCKVQCISTLPSYMFIFPHSLSLLQPHLTSSVQAFEATGRVVHTGDHFLSVFNVQPYPSGLGTPDELCHLCSKCQPGRQLFYSAAEKHLVLVELFPLFYFSNKTVLSVPHSHIPDCLSCHR